MDANFTPREFAGHLQNYHPEITEHQCNIILALITDTVMNLVREESNDTLSAIDVCNAVVKHTMQFVNDLPLSKEAYDTMMDITKRVQLDEIYENS